MSITNHLEYFNGKKALLGQLLSLSEELISNSTDFDQFVIILNKREDVIQKLLELDHLFKAVFSSSLTSGQESELNHLVTLILGLDGHAKAVMTDEKNKISETIKTNMLEQKFFKYNSNSPPQGGDLLDYKK